MLAFAAEFLNLATEMGAVETENFTTYDISGFNFFGNNCIWIDGS